MAAWRSIAEDPDKRRDWVSRRGRGGFVRVGWDEINEMIAAANAYTVKEYGPDRIAGFSPIPAMSMISYAAGSRYLSLLGSTLLSFYDWYCDLPPSSPQTWGEQTDVPESADWYNAGFLLVWGSNVPMTRAPDAHFYSEVRYRGAKSAVIAPDYNEAAKFSDIWLHPKQGTDAALALAFGHVALREFHLDKQSEYFTDYTRKYSDFPLLVTVQERDGRLVPDRMLRAADLEGNLGETNNPDWKAVGIDETTGELVAPLGSSGFRWGEQGKWNLEEKDGKGRDIRLRMTLAEHHDSIEPVAFPYFGGTAPHDWKTTAHDKVLMRNVPLREVALADGATVRVATVFDLYCANYGLDRGFGGGNVAKSYDDDMPFTPAWAEKVTGTPREAIIQVAREFAQNAETTRGRSMVILGAGLNHWYHMDMAYRGIIQLLVMCGCIGQSGGGWAHYVGQEKLRPQTGWLPLAFALDWSAAAAADERHQLLLRPYRPVALRHAEAGRDPVAAGAAGRLVGLDDRLQRARRADGLASFRAAAAGEPAGTGTRVEGSGRQSRRGDRQAAEGRRRSPWPAPTRTIRATGRATCSSGARTCWGPPARATNTSSSTSSARSTAWWAPSRPPPPTGPRRSSGTRRRRSASWT